MNADAKARAAVRTVWLLTIVTFAGAGVGLVWWPSAQTIGAYRGAAALYYDEAERNEEQVRDAAALREVQRRVVTDLDAVTVSASTGAAASALLRLLSAESKSYGVAVASVTPGATAQTPSGPFETIPLDIALRGRLDGVLRCISDLPRHDVLLEIRETSISASQEHDGGLAVTVHATLYRFIGPLPREDDHASGAV